MGFSCRPTQVSHAGAYGGSPASATAASHTLTHTRLPVGMDRHGFGAPVISGRDTTASHRERPADGVRSDEPNRRLPRGKSPDDQPTPSTSARSPIPGRLRAGRGARRSVTVGTRPNGRPGHDMSEAASLPSSRRLSRSRRASRTGSRTGPSPPCRARARSSARSWTGRDGSYTSAWRAGAGSAPRPARGRSAAWRATRAGGAAATGSASTCATGSPAGAARPVGRGGGRLLVAGPRDAGLGPGEPRVPLRHCGGRRGGAGAGARGAGRPPGGRQAAPALCIVPRGADSRWAGVGDGALHLRRN